MSSARIFCYANVGSSRLILGAANEDQMVIKLYLLTLFVQCSFSACSVITQSQLYKQ